MRWGALLLGLLLSASASAQQLEEHPKAALSLSLDQVQLIVQTLGAISCPTVAAMTNCNLAIATLNEIKTQITAQQK